MSRPAILAIVAILVAGCGDFFPNPDNVVLRDYELSCATGVPRGDCEG